MKFLMYPTYCATQFRLDMSHFGDTEVSLDVSHTLLGLNAYYKFHSYETLWRDLNTQQTGCTATSSLLLLNYLRYFKKQGNVLNSL